MDYATRDRASFKRYLEARFLIGLAIPLLVSIVLVASFYHVPTSINPLRSFPVIISVLYIYFTMIPLLLGLPPFLSRSFEQHSLLLKLVALLLGLISLYDVSSSFIISESIQEILRQLGLPVSGIFLTNLTYFLSMIVGGLLALVSRIRQHIKVDVAWYVKMGPESKKTAYLPPHNLRKKGFAVLIRNKTDKRLVITNIRLKTLIDPPLVPLWVTKAFFDEQLPSFHGFNLDKTLNLPIEIEAKKDHILYIPWETMKEAYAKISDKVDFSKTATTSYISVLDEFIGKSWDSTDFHIVRPLIAFIPNMIGEEYKQVNKARVVMVWQFGSNMDEVRLNSPKRLSGSARFVGLAIKRGYKLAFTHTSSEGVGTSDILESEPSDYVIGVLYQIPETKIPKLRSIEGVNSGAYKEVDDFEVTKLDERINETNQILQVVTYIVIHKEKNPQTNSEYANHVLKGIKNHRMGREYFGKITKIILENNPDIKNELIDYDN